LNFNFFLQELPQYFEPLREQHKESPQQTAQGAGLEGMSELATWNRFGWYPTCIGVLARGTFASSSFSSVKSMWGLNSRSIALAVRPSNVDSISHAVDATSVASSTPKTVLTAADAICPRTQGVVDKASEAECRF
jgi:hypothetical protein